MVISCLGFNRKHEIRWRLGDRGLEEAEPPFQWTLVSRIFATWSI
jgi:hypothetical protein